MPFAGPVDTSATCTQRSRAIDVSEVDSVPLGSRISNVSSEPLVSRTRNPPVAPRFDSSVVACAVAVERIQNDTV
jgi:hypothetical protein